MNTTDPSGGEKYRLRLMVGKPAFGGALIGQIEHLVLGDQNLAAFAGEPARDRRAHHAVMTGDVDPSASEFEQCGSRHEVLESPLSAAKLFD